ncbi:hypothetical protein Tco_0923383 [Tanacetum coccineum]|uniref:Uncharacterized protein n=1 Tax=Tanacetum coccineum TaxID=301880 RepID=A0ABQ5D800_9ASTR
MVRYDGHNVTIVTHVLRSASTGNIIQSIGDGEDGGNGGTGGCGGNYHDDLVNKGENVSHHSDGNRDDSEHSEGNGDDNEHSEGNEDDSEHGPLEDSPSIKSPRYKCLYLMEVKLEENKEIKLIKQGSTPHNILCAPYLSLKSKKSVRAKVRHTSQYVRRNVLHINDTLSQAQK